MQYSVVCSAVQCVLQCTTEQAAVQLDAMTAVQAERRQEKGVPPVHCILYTVHCIRYTVHYILYTVLYTRYCILYTRCCTLDTVHCTLYTVH